MYIFSKSLIDRNTDKPKCTIVEVLIDFTRFHTVSDETENSFNNFSC